MEIKCWLIGSKNLYFDFFLEPFVVGRICFFDFAKNASNSMPTVYSGKVHTCTVRGNKEIRDYRAAIILL